MGQPKRGIATRSGPAEVQALLADILPKTVEDLAGFELMSHCDRCGRMHRVYPGPHDLHPRMRLVDLIGAVLCRARRDGRACGGRPRRLVLAREGRTVAGSYHHLGDQWTLDATGSWIEDESLFWEEADFAAR
jgi:hypothetical protein